MESSIIGFFALILSFTFSTANDGYEKRLANIHAEADIIGKMLRQNEEMPETIQGNINNYLKAYLQLQIGVYSRQLPQTEWMSRGEIILQNFSGYLKTLKKDAVQHSWIDPLQKNYNDLSMRFYNNLYAISERTPPLIMFLILISSLLIGCLVGFTNGFQEKRHYLVPVIYVFMVVFTVQAIKDLDNPFGGFIKPDVSNLKDLYSKTH